MLKRTLPGEPFEFPISLERLNSAFKQRRRLRVERTEMKPVAAPKECRLVLQVHARMCTCRNTHMRTHAHVHTNAHTTQVLKGQNLPHRVGGGDDDYGLVSPLVQVRLSNPAYDNPQQP